MARFAATFHEPVVVRVALVSPYALSVHGGVQEQVLAMSRELAGRGHDVLIIAPDSSDHSSYDTPATVVRLGHLLSLPANGSRAPLTLSPRASSQALRAVSNFSPSVVHFHEPFAPLIGWATLWAHRFPAVATFHRSGDGPALKWTGPLLRALAAKIDVAAGVSSEATTTIESAAGVKAELLFNGFESARFVAEPRIRDDGVLLVALGRLESRKGMAHAINAVRTHNDRSSQKWKLVLVGDGPERAMLEALAAHDECITFEGAVSDSEKRRWLRRANAVIAPSTRGESFGLVLLEAMASESNIVASDIAGYRDAAGPHAALFAPGDASALELAIEQSLASETIGRIAAARAYAENWSMQSLMDKYEVLYDKARAGFTGTR